MNIEYFRNVSNTEIAKSLKVTSQCVSQWFIGKRQPSIEQLPNLAETLNCSIEDLVKELISIRRNYKKRKTSNEQTTLLRRVV